LPDDGIGHHLRPRLAFCESELLFRIAQKPGAQSLKEASLKGWRLGSINVIFVTVGSTEPFDRLVKTIDQWAQTRRTGAEVSIQLGNGAYKPKACQYVRFLAPTDYMRYFARSQLIISHAGIGTIITALEAHKRIIVLPRLLERGELLSEHQLATVRHLNNKQVIVAESEHDLVARLDRLLEWDALDTTAMYGRDCMSTTHPELIAYIRSFINRSTPVADGE